MVMSDDDNCKDDIGLCEWFLNPANDHIGMWAAVFSTGIGVVVGAVVGSRFKGRRWIPAALPIAVRDTRSYARPAFAVGWTF
jgi:O-antigen/teichoic acid export membrane protein